MMLNDNISQTLTKTIPAKDQKICNQSNQPNKPSLLSIVEEKKDKFVFALGLRNHFLVE